MPFFLLVPAFSGCVSPMALNRAVGAYDDAMHLFALTNTAQDLKF
ncbi:MAG: hypothetical protein SCG81_04090 [Nitrosomonadaceae bacterium]|nr:hypothetical protein [Nitrosomonadaceae bacterium]MDW7665593.1 hypothetical protein [Nitrosomonadaceae bacterium]